MRPGLRLYFACLSVLAATVRVVRFTKREYEDYIASPAWAAKRQQALKRHGPKCAACQAHGPALHVHHHTYERFRREALDDLVVLCAACHKAIHKLHDAQRFSRAPTVSLTEVTFAYLHKANPAAYSKTVLADHTPPVLPLPPRTDGKRIVSMDRRARTPRGSGGNMSGKTLRANRGRRPGL